MVKNGNRDECLSGSREEVLRFAFSMPASVITSGPWPRPISRTRIGRQP